MPVADLVARPLPGDAGVDAEGGSLLAKSQNGFQARTVEPAGGPRVPRPSHPPDVGRLRVDVGGDGVGLALVAVKVRAAARMTDGAQQVEVLDRLVY